MLYYSAEWFVGFSFYLPAVIYRPWVLWLQTYSLREWIQILPIDTNFIGLDWRTSTFTTHIKNEARRSPDLPARERIPPPQRHTTTTAYHWDTRPPMLQDPTPRAQLMYSPSEHMLALTPVRPKAPYICKRDLYTYNRYFSSEVVSQPEDGLSRPKHVVGRLFVHTNIVVFFNCHLPDLWSTVVIATILTTPNQLGHYGLSCVLSWVF